MNMPGFTAEASLYKSVVQYKFNGNIRLQGPTGQIEALASSSIVAYSSPNGLIASTGNLYWTSTIYDEFGPDISTVWRAGKNNVPGNEIILYREYGDDRYFGDIVYANPGAFYGYFVANKLALGTCSGTQRVSTGVTSVTSENTFIKAIPLAPLYRVIYYS